MVAGNLTVFGSAVVTNTLTFDGGYFKIFHTTGGTSAGTLVNNMVVNTTGTLEYSGRSNSTGKLTGSGIFNVITHYVRSENNGNWSGFTLTVNDGTLIASALSNVNNNSGGVTLNVNSGSATFNGGLNALGNTIANWVINANGGTLTAASMSLGRSGLSFTAEPGAGATGVGLNINGGTVRVTGALNMGIVAGANSSVSVLLNSGSMTVDGPLTIGLNNGGRWSVVDVNGGTLTATDVTNDPRRCAKLPHAGCR